MPAECLLVAASSVLHLAIGALLLAGTAACGPTLPTGRSRECRKVREEIFSISAMPQGDVWVVSVPPQAEEFKPFLVQEQL